MQSILTRQYDSDRQGECVGVLSQQGVLACVPAYPIGLLFSYTIKPNAIFHWPGIPFAAAAVFHALGALCHFSTHGTAGLSLVRKDQDKFVNMKVFL